MSGPYPVAALALIRAVERHIGISVPVAALEEEARQLGSHLNSLAKSDDTTRAYVERLESMVDEERLPAGDELISEIERFLRESGSGERQPAVLTGRANAATAARPGEAGSGRPQALALADVGASIHRAGSLLSRASLTHRTASSSTGSVSASAPIAWKPPTSRV